MAIIKLKGSDDQIIEVEEKVASMSVVIMGLLSEGVHKHDGGVIPLKNVDSAILTTVMAYCKKHAYEAEAEDLKAWDEQFKEQIESFPKLFSLLNASDFLDIADLVELATQKAVEMMTDLSVEQVREVFMLPMNDFTAKEAANIRQRFAWAFE